ncbi:MAG: hypothetical protein UR31_C0025G0015 [Parcubacteria group bacterium GW2011_GWA2_33_14]|nr:MAG: hypothetical protein UR31_C0025G0015 [Parcubacteria group bacterium GW2011_GWA2_33_14]OGZ70914.1 MAG: hypothetical protein A2980_02750 [Candidatus Staskawiczbacteria bacterium RIFCSPLOWO2_01_FULL_33_13]
MIHQSQEPSSNGYHENTTELEMKLKFEKLEIVNMLYDKVFSIIEALNNEGNTQRIGQILNLTSRIKNEIADARNEDDLEEISRSIENLK